MFTNTIRKLVMDRINKRIAEAENNYRRGRVELKKKLKEEETALANKLVNEIINF